MTYTKGEWREVPMNRCRSEVRCGVTVVAEFPAKDVLDGPNNWNGYPPKEEQAGNIALFLAAPELLEACKMALGAFEHNWAIDWDLLQRAIDKAEGPQ